MNEDHCMGQARPAYSQAMDNQVECHMPSESDSIRRQLLEHLEAAEDLLRELRSHTQLATKQDLVEMEKRIMATVAEAFKAIQGKLDTLSTDQAELKQDVADVVAGFGTLASTIADLKKQIDALNSGPGQIGPADQPAFDKIQATADAADAQTKDVNSQLKALVVPAVPVVPPVPPAP